MDLWSWIVESWIVLRMVLILCSQDNSINNAKGIFWNRICIYLGVWPSNPSQCVYWIKNKVSGRFATLLFATGLFAIGIIATGNIRHRNFGHNAIHLLGFFATLTVEILSRMIRHSHSEMWRIILVANFNYFEESPRRTSPGIWVIIVRKYSDRLP